nr:thioredoxin family protein [Desulfurococcales archaeon]
MAEAAVDREALELARRKVLELLSAAKSGGEQLACCSTPEAGGIVEARSLEELTRAVRSCRVAVVFFDSPTCPYCRIFRPQFYEAAQAYGDSAAFVRILVTDAPDAAAAFGVMGVPTVILFRRGEEVDRIVGLPAPGVFEAIVEEL